MSAKPPASPTRDEILTAAFAVVRSNPQTAHELRAVLATHAAVLRAPIVDVLARLRLAAARSSRFRCRRRTSAGCCDAGPPRAIGPGAPPSSASRAGSSSWRW